MYKRIYVYVTESSYVKIIICNFVLLIFVTLQIIFDFTENLIKMLILVIMTKVCSHNLWHVLI